MFVQTARRAWPRAALIEAGCLGVEVDACQVDFGEAQVMIGHLQGDEGHGPHIEDAVVQVAAEAYVARTVAEQGTDTLCLVALDAQVMLQAGAGPLA